MTTPPVLDTRTYRTELEQPSACGGRWSLYVDGRLIARSDGPLDHLAAQAWACAQLGEGVTWLNGRVDPIRALILGGEPCPARLTVAPGAQATPCVADTPRSRSRRPAGPVPSPPAAGQTSRPF